MARMALGHLVRFCDRVGNSLQAGVDVRRVWESESHRGPRRQRDEMERMRALIEKGESLAVAFSQADGFFPPLLCEMVEVGERTGRLDEVFFRLSEHYDHILRLRRGFLIGIAWPIFELILALIVIGVLIAILGAIGAEWNGKPLSVMGLHGKEGLMIYTGILTTIAGVITGIVLAARSGRINMGPFVRLLTHTPGIGTSLRTMALSRMIWSLAISMDSDLDTYRAVEIAVRSTQNPYYTSHLDSMRQVIMRGDPLHRAFRDTHIYPDDFLDALETGETAGRISETMHTLAKQYEGKAKSQYKVLAVAAGVAVMLLVFAIMIFFIFQLLQLYLMPIYETLEEI